MRPQRGTTPSDPAPLGLWDAVSIILGIIIGVGIFKAPAEVFRNASGPGQVLLVWLLVGIPSLLGALCYAELASTYPRSGGEYVYLTRAYGPGAGFLFAWAQLILIRPIGGIAMPACIFADAAAELWGLPPWPAAMLAALAIAGLTLINILGVSPGKRTINLLTATKIACLGAIVVVGLCWAPSHPAVAVPVTAAPSFFVMLMAVVYTFDGWNEAAYVSREVRDPRRNLPRALIIGVLSVTGIYLLVNSAYLVGLGFDGARSSDINPAAALLTRVLGDASGRVMNLLIMIAVLGALTGMIFTGARIFSEMGADHPLFAPLAWWSPRWQTPVCSLVVQALISIAVVIGVHLVWQTQDRFEQLLKCTGPVFYLFFLLTGLALFVLRFRDAASERPFRVPLYTLTPLLFCGFSGFMLFGSLRDAPMEGLLGLGVLLAGVPLYLLSQWLRRPTATALPGPHQHCGQWAQELQGTKVQE